MAALIVFKDTRRRVSGLVEWQQNSNFSVFVRAPRGALITT